jgi:hypothetical protein
LVAVECAKGLVIDSSSLDVSQVEWDMRKVVWPSGLVVIGLIAATGCSSSTPSQPAQIDGMSPAEYREKAEPPPVTAKTKKTGGARR